MPDFTVTLTDRQVAALKWEADRRNAQSPPTSFVWTAPKVFYAEIKSFTDKIEHAYLQVDYAILAQRLKALSLEDRAKLANADTWAALVVWLATQNAEGEVT